MALPGILTGLILALSRAIGETAPLISIGALTFVAFAPDSIWSPFTVLPIQIFNWVSRPQVEFQANAAAGILVLLVAAPDDERGGNLAAGPLPEETVMSKAATPYLRSLANVGRTRPGPAAGRRSAAEDRRQRAELLLRREARAGRHLDRRSSPNVVTAFIGPSGCGKSTFLRTLNRMNDIIPGTRVDGKVLIDGAGHLRSGRRRRRAAPAGRHGVPEVEPVPEVDLRERRLRPAHQRHGRSRGRDLAGASRRACGRRRSGTRSRTGCTTRRWRSRAASSSGSASRGRWPSSPRSC